MGIFGSDQDEADADESNERMAPAATGLVEKLLHVGIEGAGRFDSALTFLASAMASSQVIPSFG